MAFALTLVFTPGATAQDLSGPARALLERLYAAAALVPLADHVDDLILPAEADPVALRVELMAALADAPIDWALQPQERRRKRLLVADMDSTIITVECVDELADLVGLKAEISAITEAAMRGELDFEAALLARVGRLAGLPVSELARCYAERVRLNQGADTLVRTMTAHGARCVLVSGGFTAFTERVAEAAGFHAHHANTLLDDGERLTGDVARPILGREAKLAWLRREAEALGVTPAEALAIGDGANDLAMIEAAGLGVAYRAKPIVAAQADASIAHTDLTTALYFQGYAEREFAPASV